MRKKLYALFTVAWVMVLSFGLFVSSAYAGAINIPTSDVASLTHAWNEATEKNKEVFTVTLKANTPASNVDGKPITNTLFTYDNKEEITFNEVAFQHATDASRQAALGNFVKMLSNSGVSEQTQQNIVDNMSSTSSDVNRLLIPLVMASTSADIFTAMKWIAPLLPIIRVIFGVGAIIISIALIGSTIIDLAFMGLPFAREGMQNSADSKGRGRVLFVTSEAHSVIKESESSLDSSGGYKNVYFMYFKRRAMTYLILSICLLYLVVGELGGLIGWVLSLGNGIVGG